MPTPRAFNSGPTLRNHWSKAAFDADAAHAITLAEAEGLDAHAAAIRARIERL